MAETKERSRSPNKARFIVSYFPSLPVREQAMNKPRKGMKNFSSNDEPEECAHQDRVVTVKEIYKKK
jgi:hypothetical protein